MSAITFDESAGQHDELGYPRFSGDELARRRRALLDLAQEAEVDGLVLYGAAWSGSAVPWLTEWPTTNEAVVVVTADETDALMVQHHNHVPQARQLARRCAVSWAGPSTLDGLREELARRGLRRGRLGWIGTLRHAHASSLGGDGFELVDLSRGYTQLRLRKSSEELDWLRHGARLSDLGLQALLDGLRPGMTEWQVGDLIERGYVPHGGSTVIHHICATSMADPDTGVPRQHRSNRRVEAGDAVTVEISAAWWGYSGQILRTVAVQAEPSPLYAELHAVAERAYESIRTALRPGATAQDLVAASSVIEDAGFTIIDDLVHGYGGGYLPPVLGTRSRPAGTIPDFTYEEGMVAVIQPNVTTRDWKAGVQTGELVEVTTDGARSMHAMPEGLLTVR